MKVPEFAIAQNDKTRRTMLWSIDHWKELPEEDYEIVALIAKLLRTSKDPNKVLQDIVKANDWWWRRATRKKVLLLGLRMSYPLCYTVCMINEFEIRIEAKANATNRTKDRIRQHGQRFTLLRRNDNALPPMWLLKASDGWMGWLDKREFVHLGEESAWLLLK